MEAGVNSKRQKSNPLKATLLDETLTVNN